MIFIYLFYQGFRDRYSGKQIFRIISQSLLAWLIPSRSKKVQVSGRLITRIQMSEESTVKMVNFIPLKIFTLHNYYLFLQEGLGESLTFFHLYSPSPLHVFDPQFTLEADRQHQCLNSNLFLHNNDNRILKFSH